MKDYLSEFDRFMKKRQLALRGIMDLNFAYMLEEAAPDAPEPAPQKPEPQVAPFWWEVHPVSVAACEAATKAMCS